MNGKRYTVYDAGDDAGAGEDGRRRPGRGKAMGRRPSASTARLGSGAGARSGKVGQLPAQQRATRPSSHPQATATGAAGGASAAGADGSSQSLSRPLPPRQVYARPRRRWPLVLGIVTLVVFAGLCGVGGYFFGVVQAAADTMQDNYKKIVGDVNIKLATATGSEAQNILLIGSDRREKSVEGQDDPGRSDTMMLLRLDPNSGSISMLSIPRDLWVEIPGYGMDRMNTSYTLGGPAKTVAMFEKLTNLPIHHFIDVNFLGFVHIVDQLGGAYIDCDRRYYNPPGTGWAAIDLQPGYQLMTGRQALQFCRFRHDNLGDFGRMVRQQIFLSEVKRQAGRWGSTILKGPAILKTISRNTVSDINSVGKFIGLIDLVLGLDTGKIYKVHVEGVGAMIDGKSVQQPAAGEVSHAVYQLTHPKLGPVQAAAPAIPRDSYIIRVLNGGGRQGMAGRAAAALDGKGYNAEENGNADSFDYTNSVIYTTAGLEEDARRVGKTLGGASIKIVPRLPGTLGGMSVIVGASYTGVTRQQSDDSSTTARLDQTQLVRNVNQDAAQWQVWAGQTPLNLEMPTAWSPGMSYATDHTGGYSARAYTIPTGHGQRAAFVVVGQTQSGGFWHIQATSWTDPPIMQDPNEKRTINGRQYTLFYHNDRLHRVAWRSGGTLLWITNTLNDQIANDVLLGLATSSRPVR